MTFHDWGSFGGYSFFERGNTFEDDEEEGEVAEVAEEEEEEEEEDDNGEAAEEAEAVHEYRKDLFRGLRNPKWPHDMVGLVITCHYPRCTEQREWLQMGLHCREAHQETRQCFCLLAGCNHIEPEK